MTKTPIWQTKVTPHTSGRERRISYWSYPRYRFELSHEFLREDSFFSEQKRLLNFFNEYAGKGRDFCLFDREDHSVPRTRFGVGDGVTKIFRLYRPLGTGAQLEPVRATFGTADVWVGGALLAADQYTLSGDGVITFTTAPAAGAALEWKGQMMFRVRFDVDEWAFSQMNCRLWVPKTVPMLSVKV